MTRASTFLGLLRSTIACADMGHVVALRAADATAMSAISRQVSRPRIRGRSGPPAEALAAAVEVEMFFASWRARHRPPEQQTSPGPCACSVDRRIPDAVCD